MQGREQSMLSTSTPQKRDIAVDGAAVPFSSSKARVGKDVGRRVGAFVWSTVGGSVTNGSSVAEGSFAHGVFGKHARPEGHSELSPLSKRNHQLLVHRQKRNSTMETNTHLGQGLLHVDDASLKSVPQ